MVRMRIPLLLAAGLAILVSCNNNLATAIGDKIALSEEVPPVPGQNGVLTVGTERATVLPLSWQRAADNVSGSADLEYRVVRSPNIDLS